MGSLAPFGIVLLVFLLLVFNCSKVSSEPQVPAIYVFGDSIVDPGNNNWLVTIVKSNFPPYGQDFPGGIATGRFTNGKLMTDMLSGSLGLPDLVPAYLDPLFTGQRLLTGCSFASASAGIYDGTSIPLGVLTLNEQLAFFRRYRARLTFMIGKDFANTTISEAVFVLSSGTNDFDVNYFINPITRARYNITQFQDLLLRYIQKFTENVYNEGATKLLIRGLPPFGCFPVQITLHKVFNNSCVDEINEMAMSYNIKLQALIKTIKTRLSGFQIVYIDAYTKLNDMVTNPSKYGFEEVSKGCCGTGRLETAELCNKLTTLCHDASRYIFWDSIHPTLAAYTIIFKDLFQQVKRQIHF